MFGIYEPEDAEVGKLYRIRVEKNNEDDMLPNYYCFDLKGNLIEGQKWPLQDNVVCLVLQQYHSHTRRYAVLLVGENIIHLEHESQDCRLSLVPVAEDKTE